MWVDESAMMWDVIGGGCERPMGCFFDDFVAFLFFMLRCRPAVSNPPPPISPIIQTLPFFFSSKPPKSKTKKKQKKNNNNNN